MWNCISSTTKLEMAANIWNETSFGESIPIPEPIAYKERTHQTPVSSSKSIVNMPAMFIFSIEWLSDSRKVLIVAWKYRSCPGISDRRWTVDLIFWLCVTDSGKWLRFLTKAYAYVLPFPKLHNTRQSAVPYTYRTPESSSYPLLRVCAGLDSQARVCRSG